MFISKDIIYVGVNDKKIDLFEGQFKVPNGMSYNSYVISDEKIAVLDTVDAHFGKEWLENVSAVLCGRAPAYLVVHHMEPDHSACIKSFLETYPSAVVVSSAKAFLMMQSYFGESFENRRIVVKEGDELPLGKHTLTFIGAAMVHWPEVVMSYEKSENTLFSADAFGKFGALDADDSDWACEARRYYFGIVGKFGAAVQNVLKKVAALDVKRICPLHGPVLSSDLSSYLDLYKTWSSYEAESEGVFIAYTSVYGHTKEAAELLKAELEKNGQKVVISDLVRCDMSEAVEDAFRYDRLVLATTTYNGDVFPFMSAFVHHLTGLNYQNRTIGLIENGSWAPTSAKTLKGRLENCKNVVFCEPVVTVNAALSGESRQKIAELAAALGDVSRQKIAGLAAALSK